MITNSGKLILGKFLINQASSYASHIAVGCGADPRTAVSFALASKARSANTVTMVTSAAHDLRVGDSILISGAGTTYDGVFTVLTIADSTHFTYTSTGADLSTTSISDATVTLEFSSKQTLDYEMFRVPIISRSFINEDGISKVVFAGELPTTNRYEMTEIGIYSAGSNPLATTSDSRHLALFSQNVENWQYHDATSAVAITQPLDSSSNVLYTIGSSGSIDTANITNKTAFYGNSSDVIFDYISGANARQNRFETKERPRFADNFLAIRGNTSSVGMQSTVNTISTSSNVLTITTNTDHNLSAGDMIRITGASPTQYSLTNAIVESKVNATAFTVLSPVTGSYTSNSGTVTVVRSGSHIHNTSIRADLSKNSSEDQLKLAFSLLKVTPQTNNGIVGLSDARQPDNVNVVVEFSTSETEAAGAEFARLETTLTSADIDAAKDSLYFVITKKLSEVITTEAFSWSNIRSIKVYVCVTEDNAPSGDYYVALDGLRFENTTAINANPLYGMTAYGIIGNSDSTTIVDSGTAIPFGSPVSKKPNTNNLIEFKFAIGVG